MLKRCLDSWAVGDRVAVDFFFWIPLMGTAFWVTAFIAAATTRRAPISRRRFHGEVNLVALCVRTHVLMIADEVTV